MNKNKIDKVINGGYCVGCGACAFVAKTHMEINDYGEYQPNLAAFANLDDCTLNKVNFVCPSLNPEFNENILAANFLETKNLTKSDYIGFYQSIYGGFVNEGDYRNGGTSGGFGTWIGAELLKLKLIDGIIHIKDYKDKKASDPFFTYQISKSIDELNQGARTKYHAVELSGVLNLIQDNPGKYLLIGVPCMIKAIRRVQLQDPVINKSIKYTVALVCGHLKSINWTYSLAWAKGIKPKDATTFRYRTKGPNIPARAYVFTAYSNNSEVMEDSGNVIGGKFNQGALMLNACNFCDDVVGETADITIGDAWLPKFETDSKGTNLLIIRNTEIEHILKNSFREKRISIVNLTEKEAKDAQSGGFRQRREGLSFRLHKMDKQAKWRPTKRIEPNSFNIVPLRKIIYAMRFNVTKQSREVFQRALVLDDYTFYEKKMRRMLKTLRILEISSSATRIIRKKIAYLLHK